MHHANGIINKVVEANVISDPIWKQPTLACLLWNGSCTQSEHGDLKIQSWGVFIPELNLKSWGILFISELGKGQLWIMQIIQLVELFLFRVEVFLLKVTTF